MTRKKQKFEVHVGDEIYFRDRRIVVLQVNRDCNPHRVFITSRKHKKSASPWMRWVCATELARRPSHLVDADKTVASLSELAKKNNGYDLIDWEPGCRGREHKDFQPSQYLPGSIGKIEVLAERVAKGLPLWHPRDMTFGDVGMMIADGQLVPDTLLKHLPNYVPPRCQLSKIEQYGATKIVTNGSSED
ncbi:MAG: hypothetical protein KF752_11810 [Pirellulaceae bacterium]|nr:hypothetical protein [Pirellulaceae bacterium]